MMDTDSDPDRDLRYPEPLNGSRNEWVKGSLKARRSLGLVRVNTREVTAVGLAVSEWFCRLVDVAIAVGQLEDEQARVMELYYLTEHVCRGSLLFVARGVQRVTCPVCRFHEPIAVDRRGFIVEHYIPYTNLDVAKALGVSTRTVARHKAAAIRYIKSRLLPVGHAGEDEDSDA